MNCVKMCAKEQNILQNPLFWLRQYNNKALIYGANY